MSEITGAVGLDAAASSGVRTVRSVSLIGLTAAALLMGVLSWYLLVRLDNFFPPQPIGTEMENRIRADAHDEIAWAWERKLRWDNYWHNACLSIGAMGVCLGVALGAVSGYAGGGVVRGLVLGLILGAAGGVLAGLVSSKVAIETDSNGALDSNNRVYDPILRSVMIHSGGFAALGLLSGLLVALAARRPRSLPMLLISGVTAGVLASVFYELVGATAFNMYRTDLPIPEGNLNKLAFVQMLGLVMSVALWRAATLPDSTGK